MTDCSPHSIDANLYSACTLQWSINQTNCSINAMLGSCGEKDCYLVPGCPNNSMCAKKGTNSVAQSSKANYRNCVCTFLEVQCMHNHRKKHQEMMFGIFSCVHCFLSICTVMHSDQNYSSVFVDFHHKWGTMFTDAHSFVPRPHPLTRKGVW